MKHYYKLAFTAAMLILLCACVSGSRQPSNSTLVSPDVSAPSADSSGVVITFDFEKQSGYASNQFAVWIEDTDGNLVKTLYATRFTAKGGYKNRPDSIPTWVVKSGLASMSKNEVDAITGATPKSGTLTYTWDLTDMDANAVPNGEYNFYVEGSLRWKNRVMYSGVIDVGNAHTTEEATAEYFYEASDGQASLTDDSLENKMISSVIASFVPVG